MDIIWYCASCDKDIEEWESVKICRVCEKVFCLCTKCLQAWNEHRVRCEGVRELHQIKGGKKAMAKYYEICETCGGEGKTEDPNGVADAEYPISCGDCEGRGLVPVALPSASAPTPLQVMKNEPAYPCTLPGGHKFQGDTKYERAFWQVVVLSAYARLHDGDDSESRRLFAQASRGQVARAKVLTDLGFEELCKRPSQEKEVVQEPPQM